MLSTPEAFDAYPAELRQRRFIRRTKEEMVHLDGRPLYPTRISETLTLMAEHAQADKEPALVPERQKKRECRFQLQVERLNDFLKDREPNRGSDGKEIQSNAVDNGSVKMPSSHGVIQGYNAQALVDSKHQVILAAEACASQDHDNLKPLLAGAKKNVIAIGKEPTFFEGKQLTADPILSLAQQLEGLQR